MIYCACVSLAANAPQWDLWPPDGGGKFLTLLQEEERIFTSDEETLSSVNHMHTDRKTLAESHFFLVVV